MSTKSHPSFYSLFSMEKKLKPTYRIDISWWTFGDFGRIKKGKLPYFTKERRISLLEISYAHVGSILGLGTASQANDQTFLIWLWTEDLCLVLRTWSLYRKKITYIYLTKQAPCYYHLDIKLMFLNPLGNTSAIFLE